MKNRKLSSFISIMFVLFMFSACSADKIKQDTKPTEPETQAVSLSKDVQNQVLTSDDTDNGEKAEKPTTAENAEEYDEVSEPEGPSCTLCVKCDSVLNRLDKLPEEKARLIPADGIIYERQKVFFTEGESVFDVLNRELAKRRIPLEYKEDKILKSVYIRGINNLYEFDGGANSGWIYTVNGKSPTYGCSEYKIKDGDEIEFFYT